MNRNLNAFAKHLNSNAEWLKFSLVRAEDVVDLLNADAEVVAIQLVEMGFTHLQDGAYVETDVDTLIEMINAFDEE